MIQEGSTAIGLKSIDINRSIIGHSEVRKEIRALDLKIY